MTLDPVILSRLQFFWVVSFHILLPAFTVGLACYIATLEALHLKTRDRTYLVISIFWTNSCGLVRAWRRLGHRDAFSIRHQLEPFLR